MKRIIPVLVMLIVLTSCNMITGNVVADNTGLTVSISESERYVLVGDKVWFTVELEDKLLESDVSVELVHNGNVINEFVVNTTGDKLFYLSIDVPEGIEGSSQIMVKAKLGDFEISDSDNFVVVNSSSSQDLGNQDNVISMNVDIPKEYQELRSGEEILTSIRLINHGSKGRVDVILDLWIENDQKNIITKNKETVAVETQANFVRTMIVPDSPPGEYSVYAQITYVDGKVAQAHQEFLIVQKPLINTYTLYGSIAVIVLAIFIIIFSVLRSKGVCKRLAIRSRVDRIVKRRKLK